MTAAPTPRAALDAPTVSTLLAVVAPAPPSAKPQSFGVFLGPKAYALAHVGIWLFHAVCMAYFVAAGILYRALAPTQLAGMLQLYSLTVPRTAFDAVGAAHFVVAALYGRYLIVSVARLAPSRGRKSKVAHSASQPLGSVHRASPTHLTRARTTRAASVLSRTRVWRMLTSVYDVVFAPSGFFGVESDHFEFLFLVREVTETVLQTNQAYQMSRLLPRAQFNRLYVALLATNCWSTPFFYRFGGRNRALQRLLSLLCDILLDFISAVGVPVWLALDYLTEYDSKEQNFPLHDWYDDAWVVRFMNDVPLMLLGSWVGAFSRLLFSISLLTTFDDIHALLKRKQSGVRPAMTTTAPDETASTSKTASKLEFLWKRHTRVVFWAHIAMVLYGSAIVAVQLYAESRPTPDACVLVVRPWLESQPACALIEVNCLTTPTLTGGRSDFDAILGPIDELSLEHVVFRHCQQLEVTSRMQAFRNLIGFKLYNSTIVVWDDEAAITRTHNPNLRFLFLVHIHFPNGMLPPGLISRDFPPTLRDIEISGSNLRALPDDLHERWPQQLTLFLEFGQLSAYPHVLTLLSPRMLVLCGNPITQLPAEALLLPYAYTVALIATQLTALPDEGVDPRAVYTEWIFADMTQVAAVPAWMDEAFLKRTTVYLGGSPFCVDVLQNESSTERAQLLAERPYLETLIDCYEIDPSLYPFYPQYLDVRDDEQALLAAVSA